MASIGGFAGYNEIARTGAPGSFLQGVQNYKSFFDKKAIDDAMKENRGSLADAIMKGDYNTGASIAMNAGDLDTALAFADLADKAESRMADIAYQNAQLGMKRAEFDQKQDEIAKEEQQQEDLYRSGAAALDALQELADEGKITRWNNETGGINLFGEGAERIGKRQAALSALLPLTNYVARANGGSGINTMGEMMAYLGLPENPTSDQIQGAMSLLEKKLPSGLQKYRKPKGSSTEQKTDSSKVIKVGYVEDGLRFKGGDPNDPKNWEQI